MSEKALEYLGKEVAARILQVQVRTVYGNERIYPVNEVAQKFAALLNVKTFNRQQIVDIKALGYEFVVVANEVSL